MGGMYCFGCVSGSGGGAINCDDVRNCMQGIAPECGPIMGCVLANLNAPIVDTGDGHISLDPALLADNVTIIVNEDGKLVAVVEPFQCKDLQSCVDGTTIQFAGGQLHAVIPPPPPAFSCSDLVGCVDNETIIIDGDGKLATAPPAGTPPGALFTIEKSGFVQSNAATTFNFSGSTPSEMDAGYTWDAATSEVTLTTAGVYHLELNVVASGMTIAAKLEASIGGTNAPAVHGTRTDDAVALGGAWKSTTSRLQRLPAGATAKVLVVRDGLSGSVTWNARLAIVKIG